MEVEQMSCISRKCVSHSSLLIAMTTIRDDKITQEKRVWQVTDLVMYASNDYVVE